MDNFSASLALVISLRGLHRSKAPRPRAELFAQRRLGLSRNTSTQHHFLLQATGKRPAASPTSHIPFPPFPAPPVAAPPRRRHVHPAPATRGAAKGSPAPRRTRGPLLHVRRAGVSVSRRKARAGFSFLGRAIAIPSRGRSPPAHPGPDLSDSCAAGPGSESQGVGPGPGVLATRSRA
jgi:hypothetical protein